MSTGEKWVYRFIAITFLTMIGVLIYGHIPRGG
jgi:hypothetical protein